MNEKKVWAAFKMEKWQIDFIKDLAVQKEKNFSETCRELLDRAISLYFIDKIEGKIGEENNE